MPSSSDHDTEKERRLMYSFLRAHVRLYHASQHHLNLHVLTAYAAILEVTEEQLESTLDDNIGRQLVLAEENRIAGWRDNSQAALVWAAAEMVEDSARDEAEEFGEVPQAVLWQLSEKLYWVARELREMRGGFVVYN